MLEAELKKAQDMLGDQRFENQRLREVSVQALQQIKTMQSSASNIQQALGLQRIDPEARVGVAADKVDAMKELRAEL